MRQESEHIMQVALMQWAGWHSKEDPRLSLLHAIPNGGHRHPRVAGRLKAEGVKPGIPDLFLPIAIPPEHGLYLELKVKPNKPSATQLEVIDALRAQGYRVEVCYSLAEACDVISVYLGHGKDW